MVHKSYTVAGHLFRLEMPEDSPLWTRLGQYEPFETPEAPSDAQIFTLRWGPVDPSDSSYEPIYTEHPEEEGQSRIELYKNSGGWRFKMARTASGPIFCILDCNADFTEGTFCAKGDALQGLSNALMLLFAFRTAGLKTLEMHSSVVVKDGKGYMFLGKSGTGKSTQSRMWLEAIEGAELLNDDNPIIRVMPDGKARVFGSPWSGKTPCYKNMDAEIGGIVKIRRCLENKITRLSVFEAYATIYSSCSGLKAEGPIGDGLHETMEAVALGVPFYVLDCLPDNDAARVCHETVSRYGQS